MADQILVVVVVVVFLVRDDEGHKRGWPHGPEEPGEARRRPGRVHINYYLHTK